MQSESSTLTLQLFSLVFFLFSLICFNILHPIVRKRFSLPLTVDMSNQQNQFELQPQQQPQNLQNQQAPGTDQIIRGNGARGRGSSIRGIRYTQQQTQQPSQQPPDQSQHIIDIEAIAKMLVVLESGEQLLITYVEPNESMTLEQLLEQFGVPSTAGTNLECNFFTSANIHYFVNVGVARSEIERWNIMSAAENFLQLKQQQHKEEVKKEEPNADNDDMGEFKEEELEDEVKN